jgi:hypothetical protein
MDRLKNVGATKIAKFFSCVPVEVWIHAVTLFLVFIIGGVMLAMLTNPEFAKQVFGIILILAIIGFTLFLAFHLYRMIFEFICDFLDEWDRS